MCDEDIYFGKVLLKQSETVLTHLTPVPLTFDPKINMVDLVDLLPRMDLWYKCEEGRSRRSRVIDRKRKGYIRTDRHVQSNMPSLLRRWHNQGGVYAHTFPFFQNKLALTILHFS